MSAQPIDSWPRRRSEPYQTWAPDPTRQRLANYTVEDVLFLPSDAPRVELRDGVVSVVPSPTIGHQKISALLWLWLRNHAPADYEPSIATGVGVGIKQTLEPDVLLLRSENLVLSRHYSMGENVVIAVEVVSTSTKRRDRLEKPAYYADAGVPFYWRVEQSPLQVFAYELEFDGTYRLVAESDAELVLERPFEIRLPIAEITP